MPTASAGTGRWIHCLALPSLLLKVGGSPPGGCMHSATGRPVRSLMSFLWSSSAGPLAMYMSMENWCSLQKFTDFIPAQCGRRTVVFVVEITDTFDSSSLTIAQCVLWSFQLIRNIIYIQLYSPFGRIKIKYKNSQHGHIIKNTQNIDMHAH